MGFGLRNACIPFSAGAARRLANSLAVWLFGKLGITAVLGVAIAPDWTPGLALSPPGVGRALGGLLFLPIPTDRPLLRGAPIGLGSTLAQLLIVFPLKAGKGMPGLDLGSLTPILVFFQHGVGLGHGSGGEPGGRALNARGAIVCYVARAIYFIG